MAVERYFERMKVVDGASPVITGLVLLPIVDVVERKFWTSGFRHNVQRLGSATGRSALLPNFGSALRNQAKPSG